MGALLFADCPPRRIFPPLLLIYQPPPPCPPASTSRAHRAPIAPILMALATLAPRRGTGPPTPTTLLRKFVCTASRLRTLSRYTPNLSNRTSPPSAVS